ncbi:DoxX family membrane protein [Halomicroarcula sp. F13]|jgi:uncharacterized membrane protein YphA (DoxX/SURF4 family)|uniref:DoxX family membrane protein n=1 Tax=Haloarcula rubra TaxID=2487747 RepID=A0AAW4PX48_9EURY|nr:DoxX family membrane protein [Halomicroarcula rubra]MBX0324852.1 DoxX family membrane protein [Halomicroarcula rubra]
MSPTNAKYRDRYIGYLDQYSEYALPVMRISLGAVIFLAGAHKLVAPDAWTKYAAPWVTALWPESIVSFELVMMANGVFELLFGVALIAGFYMTIVAGVITLSLLAVVFDLVTGVILTGKFVDILIRDPGLVALALGVTLLSAQRSDCTR